MTARDELRRAVAAEFQRLDAHQFGYDHGFCADPDADPETAAFVDAAIRIVLNATADAAATGGMLAANTTGQRVGVSKTVDLLRRMADATTSTSKEQQR